MVLRLYHWLYWLLVLTSKCYFSVDDECTPFASALEILQETNEFISREITSLPILECIQEVDEDFFSDGHYFELVSESLPSQMNDIECVCCKTYCNGACFVTFYFEGGFYVILLDTENEQALLDVSMPDITQGGEGITLKLYDRQKACSNESMDAISWKRLSLWQTIGVPIENELNEASTLSLSSSCYGQSYIILKPNKPDPSKRDVMFMFGSWAYSGALELLSELSFADVEHIIPALRVQQHKLAFLCHTTEMPIDNIFTAPLEYMAKIGNLMQQEIMNASRAVELLQIEEEDPETLLFQFEMAPHSRTVLDRCHIDCIATKSYRASGVVVMNVYFRGAFYVCLTSGGNDVGLLDSQFPSIVNEHSYNLKSFPGGISGWEDLRKLSLIRNVRLEGSSVTQANHQSLQERHNRESLQPKDCDRHIYNENELEAEAKTIDINDGSKHSDVKEQEVCQPKSERNEGQEIKTQEINNFASSRNSCRRRNPKSLSGVHRLAPLKKTSQLQNRISGAEGYSGNIPWSADGRPVIQNL